MKYVVVKFDDTIDLSQLTVDKPVVVTPEGGTAINGSVFITAAQGPDPVEAVSADHKHVITGVETGPAVEP